MPRPYAWLRLAQRLSDEKLVEWSLWLIAQSNNGHWQDDTEAQAWLQLKVAEFIDELERRIAQGTLFD